jgi:hypothetical protein
VLPNVVAEDLDSDPDQLTLKCMTFLAYVKAKDALDSAKTAEALKDWDDSKLMEYAKIFTIKRHRARTGGG